MDTKKLRQKILDLAIRGKLVPQDPNDEPASVLLERIRAEKERLIKEGKIKRSKKSATDDEIEAPFEIPESWEWVRLEDLVSPDCTLGYGIVQPMEDVLNGIPVVRPVDLTSPIIGIKGLKRIDEKISHSYQRTILKGGEILFCVRASVGKVGIASTQLKGANVTRGISPLRFDYEYLTKYVFYHLQSLYSQTEIKAYSRGATLQQINVEDLKILSIALPPFAEQKHIVNEIERWFTVIDTLESNEGDLLKAIDQAKSKILDLAIHGKLVPQDPNDEPALALLKRINPNFEPCDDELYGSVSLNWTLAKVDDIGELLSGRDLSNDVCNNESKGIPYLIGASNILGNSFSFVRWTEQPQVISILGDMLISCKGTIGTIIKNNIGNMHIARQFMAIRPNEKCISSDYLNICLMAIIEEIKKNARGVIPGISREDILEKTVPLPPYQEQLRIVSKIEELFAVLDSIKESLK